MEASAVNRIDRLRRQLASLSSRQRLNLRGASLARVVVAVVVAACVLFLVDFWFDLSATQRLIAMAIGLLVLLRVVQRNLVASRSPRTSVTQTALYNAPANASDLVAALQFSSDSDTSAGSLQLKQAVIIKVETTRINVFEGFRWSEFRNSLLALVCVSSLSGVAAVFFPTYASVFLNRLALGDRLYPRATEIISVSVNSQFVLTRRSGDHALPTPAQCPQGKPVVFQVITTGRWPDSGSLKLTSQKTGADRVVELTRLTTQQRLNPLRQARSAVERALDQPDDAPALSLREIRKLVAVEIPDVLGDAPDPPLSQRATVLEQTLAKINARLGELKSGPADAVWTCEIPRLVEAAQYRLSIGDGRTASGRLDMVELPVVDLDILVTPPSYAGANVAAPTSLAREFAVLEGSDVQLTLRVLSNNPLRGAWVNVWQGETQEQVSLAPIDDERKIWRVPAGAASPLTKVVRDTRFELMAEDSGGYPIERPLNGMIRVRADRSPSGAAKVVHRVVLPTASPVVSYRVNDDFGVAKARIAAQVERQADRPDQAAEPGVSAKTTDSEASPLEKKTFLVFESSKTKDQLPAKGRYTLGLSQLGLEKGDRLKLTVEVLDYRGDQDGVWASSEPIYLEVSDESGVLAAISETDERSEQRLDDLIRRELGIGDEP